MTTPQIEFLLALYFIGVSLPGMVSNPIARGTLVQFVFGVVLLLLALFSGVRVI